MNESDLNKSCYIIAIGASSGGMEAIHSLFDNTPLDGVSYIIIQHLSPTHKSFMAELLEKHSKLKICEVENEMYVKPNQVYLMPKGKNMTIRNKTLYLTDSKARPTNTAIDIFLNSLAEDQTDKSIAIILSGMGNDGTRGIAAIKQNGGMVIVQEPSSAKFPDMPLSAIESGNADAILPPNLIPEEIISYLKREELKSNFSDEISQDNEDQLSEILHLIKQHTPLDFTNYKRPTIIRRIVIRMTINKISSLKDYIDYIQENTAELEILANDFLISVTKFFRDKEAFEVLKEKVIPEIIKNKLMVDTLKIWVVGCATGEEAYSIAILIMEHLTKLKKNLEVKIFASDIDKGALAIASKGVYNANIKNEVSEKLLGKYFIREDNKYRVRDNIRKMIIFADHDIVKQPPYGKIDLISCRNLLIYINPILQKKILSSLHFCLNPEGYLFLGSSESLGDLNKSFTTVDKKWKIYKSIEVPRHNRDTTYSTPGLNLPSVAQSNNFVPKKNIPESNLTEINNHSILEELGFEAGIYVNSDYSILQTFGNYEKYLLPKLFNFNLFEMLPEELSIATSIALKKAIKDQKKTSMDEVVFTKDQGKQVIDLVVIPIKKANEKQAIMLVLYSDHHQAKKAKENKEYFELDLHSLHHIDDLKHELATAQEKLKNSYKALDESNDNITSYNEELISSNEELQSTNEELQSVNEELQTVNNEYQLKIKELAELNDDLTNFFKGTINGQLYIDKGLILRKFTPPATKQINLLNSDIGRPLSDISTKIKLPTLIDNIHMVLRSSISIEKEIQTLDGRWYQMVITPYFKEQENINDGVIVTFNDITELKKVQHRLARINADHNNFIYSASHDLKGPVANVKGLVSYLTDPRKAGNISPEEVLNMLQISITNLTETIDELSDIAKIESEIEKSEPVNLKELFEEVRFSIQEELTKSKAIITCDFKEPMVSFSKKNLRSILLNLLSNAVKYKSPERVPEIRISTVRENNFVVLLVEDNGIGMEPYKIEEIFTIFKRKHNHIEGTGVGLYLVKKIISNAEGDILVESELGKGSTFKVYFKN
ncbi:PAS domain-containing protein [Marivirga sp. S37H4]|uniref:PAS domain-containing protein n=1 Tax=Marivirga aurantiaca TaxID=2802615 RepID=A0A935C4U9_9BACT|nr:CheR family methyltransferase [Marivirga aurantiaca]MBK6263501.1 PAS domain-containing protein [Marivirga aurantiaca]